MIETHAGLPNTCHDCGVPQTETWFAPSVDAAIAGGGICAPCLAKREGGVEVAFSGALEFTDPTLLVAALAEGDATGPPDTVAAETAASSDDWETGAAKKGKAGKGAASTKKGAPHRGV